MTASPFATSDLRAYVITCRDERNGSEYPAGDGEHVVIMAEWSADPRDILSAWIETCPDWHRETLRRVCRIHPADTRVYMGPR